MGIALIFAYVNEVRMVVTCVTSLECTATVYRVITSFSLL